MRLTWLLAAALALPLHAAERQGPPPEVHPLLLGPLSDPVSPVARELTTQSAQLAALQANGPLTPTDFSRFLAPLLAGSAAQRPAAAILAKVVAVPGAMRTLLQAAPHLKDAALKDLSGAAAATASDERERSALSDLALAASRDPYAKLVFDGVAPPSGLNGLAMTASGPMPREGGELSLLGKGTFGMVHEHPEVAGAVIKTIFFPKDWGVEARRKMYEFASDDERSARVLARAGAGPRLLAHTDELGSPVLIKERVYGSNVHDLIQEGLYDARHHRLILDLIDRLAKARLMPGDLREPNIMIGRTLLDSERKAYLIDGGELEKADSALGPRGLARAIYNAPARWLSTGSDGASTLKSKPLSQILEEALVDAGQAPWWMRLKVAWRRRAGTDRPTVEPN